MWWDYTYTNCLQFDLNQNSLMSIRKWNKGNTWGCMNCVQHTFSIHISLVILFYFPSLLSKHFQCRHLTCRAWFALWLSSRNQKYNVSIYWSTCVFSNSRLFVKLQNNLPVMFISHCLQENENDFLFLIVKKIETLPFWGRYRDIEHWAIFVSSNFEETSMKETEC